MPDTKTQSLKKDLQAKTSEMEQNIGRSSFLRSYSEFMTLAANHVTVFAPLIPALTQFLTNSAV